jgi:fructose/tagatose bisphosphate aldolase
MIKNIDELIFKAIFENQFAEISSLIRDEALKNNIVPSSLYEIYSRIASGELSGFTVPAFNLRTLTYDFARAIFRSAKKAGTGLFIFELARQEKEYTNQSFDEYVTCILSAALKEGFFHPVFIQADHVQLSRERFFESQEQELNAVKDLIKEAISAGVVNIDIDASTLVEIEQNTEKEQQRNNFKITAELIKFIKEIQPKNLVINIGGEIGEIGKKNSTPEDLCAFMDGLKEELGKVFPGITKLSIQTGTTHGGVVLPDGKLAELKIDFETIKKLSCIARENYKLAGVVQHGASTLPYELFSKFPENDCIEIHLATGIQNIFFEAEELPGEFKKKLYSFIQQKHAGERNKFATDEQFIYKTRKFALGRFKEEVWRLPQDIKDAISNRIEQWAFKIFNLLRVNNTLKMIKSLNV